MVLAVRRNAAAQSKKKINVHSSSTNSPMEKEMGIALSIRLLVLLLCTLENLNNVAASALRALVFWLHLFAV